MTQTEYRSETSTTTIDEIFAAEQSFEVLKAFKDSYFSQLYACGTFEFDDEYDKMTDTEESDNNVDDYNENKDSDLKIVLHQKKWNT